MMKVEDIDKDETECILVRKTCFRGKLKEAFEYCINKTENVGKV